MGRASTVKDDPLSRHAAAIGSTLGPSARLISPSKSRYHDAHPDHVVVFNANVCLQKDGKVWWGDLDLTLDESQLANLAEQTGQIVYLLYESDGRFKHEGAPLLDRAVHSVTPSGHTKVVHTHVDRRVDGRLYQRPPVRQPRWRRPDPPRLWRFWHLDTHHEHIRDSLGERASRLVYAGRRGHDHRSPLLVLGLHRWSHDERSAWVEWTWYPSGRRGWAPSLASRAKWHRGAIRPFVSLRLTPGIAHEIRIGITTAHRPSVS